MIPATKYMKIKQIKETEYKKEQICKYKQICFSPNFLYLNSRAKNDYKCLFVKQLISPRSPACGPIKSRYVCPLLFFQFK